MLCMLVAQRPVMSEHPTFAGPWWACLNSQIVMPACPLSCSPWALISRCFIAKQAATTDKQTDGHPARPLPARPPTRRRRNPLRRLSNKSRLRQRRRKVQSGIVFISPSGEGKRDPDAERASTESGTSCAAHNSQRGRRQEGEIPGVIADLYAPFPLRQNRKRGHHDSHALAHEL